jgi:endonuclease YncB( thermonuclease family)
MIVTVPGVVDSLHDGDTIYVKCDLGWDITEFVRVRILGINAPELKTDAGKAALAFAETLVKPGDAVTVESHGWDKYGGRTDARLVLADGRNFGQLMLDAGQAVPFGGVPV